MRSIHMSSAMLTFDPTITYDPCKTYKIFRVGDFVQFYPSIEIDYYDLSNQEEPYLQHVIYNIYKFRFRPIARYFNNEYESIYKNCYHYLIEIFPDFKLFCFNWTKPYQSYLKLGQWYEGHGQLRNCGNAAQCNKYISSLMMDRIFRTGKLTGIYKDLSTQYYIDQKIKTYNDEFLCYVNVLDAFGNSKNLDESNTNVSKYKDQSIKFNYICLSPLPWIWRVNPQVIFCVDILDQ